MYQKIVRKLILWLLKGKLSPTTKDGLIFDLLRWQIRSKTNHLKDIKPNSEKLNLGCGKKLVDGWVNVDLLESHFNWDLGCGYLPFADNSFSIVVSEHFIEHIDLETQLIPLLRDLHRCMKPGGKIFLSCPSLEKLSKSYIENKGQSLMDGRANDGNNAPSIFSRFPGLPTQQVVNETIFQKSEHKNLFDEELLVYFLDQVGFRDAKAIDEATYFEQTGGFKKRDDAFESVVVWASKP